MAARMLAVDGHLGGVADRIESQEHPPAGKRFGHLKLAAVGRFVNVGQAARTLPKARHSDLALLAAGGLDAPGAVKRHPRLLRDRARPRQPTRRDKRPTEQIATRGYERRSS